MSSYLAGQPSSDGVQLTFLGTQQGPTTSTMTQHSSRNDSMQGDQLLRVYRVSPFEELPPSLGGCTPLRRLGLHGLVRLRGPMG